MDSAQNDIFAKLRSNLQENNLPEDLRIELTERVERLEKLFQTAGFSSEFDQEYKYLEFITSLPFAKSSQDILDLSRSAQILERNHYGLKSVKNRILEYLSMLILNTRKGQELRAPVLAFVGLVGSGKTSLAYSIAESLGRKLIRIPFGGLGSTAQLRGLPRMKAEAEPGRLIKQIHQVGVNNPVVLLDEIDRVATENRADVMGVLVELLDPEQNQAFLDYYLDYPFDLSKVLFLATANNTGNIATAVLDRLEVIEMPAYSDEEKTIIGKNYLLPKAVRNAGLPEGVVMIDDSIWPKIIRPLGYDAGIRSLQRTIEKITRKIAREVVEGKTGPFKIIEENIGEYLQ